MLGTVGCDEVQASDIIATSEKYAELRNSQQRDAAAIDKAAADLVTAHNEVFPIDSWTLQLNVPIKTEIYTEIEIVRLSEIDFGTGTVDDDDEQDDRIPLKFASFGNFVQKRTAAKNNDGVIDFGSSEVFTLDGEMSVSRFVTTTDGEIAMSGTVGYFDASAEGPDEEDNRGQGELQFSATRCTAFDN